MSVHFFVFFTLIFQSCKFASSLGNETDHLSLIKFKESISNDPYGILDSWNSSTHFCNWNGISCGHKHRRVIWLDLRGHQLSGTISPFIGNLSFLRIIDLDNNNFHGEIPQELGLLFRLQEFYIQNNTLTGEFPVNITSCSNLKILAFEGNNLIGKIPMEIGSLHKLRGLYLPRNNFTGEIPTSLGNLTSLSILSLNYNNLEGSIPEERQDEKFENDRSRYQQAFGCNSFCSLQFVISHFNPICIKSIQWLSPNQYVLEPP